MKIIRSEASRDYIIKKTVKIKKNIYLYKKGAYIVNLAKIATKIFFSLSGRYVKRYKLIRFFILEMFVVILPPTIF